MKTPPVRWQHVRKQQNCSVSCGLRPALLTWDWFLILCRRRRMRTQLQWGEEMKGLTQTRMLRFLGGICRVTIWVHTSPERSKTPLVVNIITYESIPDTEVTGLWHTHWTDAVPHKHTLTSLVVFSLTAPRKAPSWDSWVSKGSPDLDFSKEKMAEKTQLLFCLYFSYSWTVK